MTRGNALNSKADGWGLEPEVLASFLSTQINKGFPSGRRPQRCSLQSGENLAAFLPHVNMKELIVQLTKGQMNRSDTFQKYD